MNVFLFVKKLAVATKLWYNDKSNVIFESKGE